MSTSDRYCPPKCSSYVRSGKPVPFSSQRKKRIKQSIPATQTFRILLRWVARGIISSQILFISVFSEVWDHVTEEGQPTTAHCTCILASRRVTFWLRRWNTSTTSKTTTQTCFQGFFSQFSILELSNMLQSEVWCPLAIANVPRSAQVTCIPANQCHFPHSKKKE